MPAGYPVHVVHRGNNSSAIFACEADFLFMRRCLQEGGIGEDVTLHSYVLMTNHLHLLLTSVDEGGISRFIQSAARRYVGYFNKKYARTGTLWEGRFHSSIVITDHYLLACHRYIDMNPVRARLAVTPDAYRWSSHRHYACGTADSLIQAHPLIVALAKDTRSLPHRLSAVLHRPMARFGPRSDSRCHERSTSDGGADPCRASRSPKENGV